MRPSRTNRLVVALLTAVLGTAMTFPTSGISGTEGLSSSDNVEFVTNLAFEVAHEESSRLATDMDFATMTVPDRPGVASDRTGPPRGVERGRAPHDLERNFAFVGTYMNGM